MATALLSPAPTITLATPASGDANSTAYTTYKVSGTIVGVIVQAAFTSGGTLVITAEDTGQPILTDSTYTATRNRYSWHNTQRAAGTNITYDGTRTVRGPCHVCDTRLKAVVQGVGNSETATLTFLVELDR